MQQNLLCNLLTTTDDRIQRGHRLLKNHTDFISTQMTHGLLRTIHQVNGFFSFRVVIKENLTLRITGNFGIKQLHNRQSGNGFARPGLTYNTQCFAFPKAKTDLVQDGFPVAILLEIQG